MPVARLVRVWASAVNCVNKTDFWLVVCYLTCSIRSLVALNCFLFCFGRIIAFLRR